MKKTNEVPKNGISQDSNEKKPSIYGGYTGPRMESCSTIIDIDVEKPTSNISTAKESKKSTDEHPFATGNWDAVYAPLPNCF